MQHVPISSGKLLVLGVGGGREAIDLSRLGFEVTGIDFSSEMVKRAERNAQMAGVRVRLAVAELSDYVSPERSFDVVWLTAGMYSSIPTKKRRVKILKEIEKWLVPGGYFICQYLFWPSAALPSGSEKVGRVFAYLTRGYLAYEPGDRLLANREFMHCFSSKGELQSEFHEAGLKIVTLSCKPDEPFGGAVLQKKTL